MTLSNTSVERIEGNSCRARLIAVQRDPRPFVCSRLNNKTRSNQTNNDTDVREIRRIVQRLCVGLPGASGALEREGKGRSLGTPQVVSNVLRCFAWRSRLRSEDAIYELLETPSKSAGVPVTWELDPDRTLRSSYPCCSMLRPSFSSLLGSFIVLFPSSRDVLLNLSQKAETSA